MLKALSLLSYFPALCFSVAHATLTVIARLPVFSEAESCLFGKKQSPTAVSHWDKEICLLAYVQKDTTLWQASSQLSFSVLPLLLLIIMPLYFCAFDATILRRTVCTLHVTTFHSAMESFLCSFPQHQKTNLCTLSLTDLTQISVVHPQLISILIALKIKW